MNDFLSSMLKSLNPKYYLDLGEKKLGNAVRYFFALVAIMFLVMAVISIPQLMFIKSDMDKSLLDISKFKVDASLATKAPVFIPKNSPILTIDTTGNKTWDKELVFITDKTISYNAFGKKKEISLSTYDLENNRKGTENAVSSLILFMLPSIIFFYYAAYALKYLAIIIGTALAAFLFAKLMRNGITINQALALSFYTSTIMIIIEILTIPFFIKDYLITYSTFIGINFSLIAITAYLTFYVTAIRLNGNPNIRH